MLLWLPSCLFAQKVTKVLATYTYIAPDNVTLEQAKITAVERAKIQAIADEFGTIVSQNNTTFIQNGNNKSSVDFQSLSGTDVKGEWIETTKEPKYKIEYLQNQLSVTVSLEGRIREIINSQIDIVAKVLCNGFADQNERSDFVSGDDLFLKVQVPMDGFLTVYLVDLSNESAYCLLPYRANNNVAYPVIHDKEYIFFSEDNATDHKEEVDEYTLTCNSGKERNDLFIIFSPNQYGKANTTDNEDLRPRELSWKDFHKWLAKNRLRDKDMQVIQKNIIISSK